MKFIYKTHYFKLLAIISILEIITLTNRLQAEEEQKKVTIDPFFNFQLWGTDQNYQSTEHMIHQSHIMFRRGRFGVNSKLGDRWKMQLQIAMDGLGIGTTDTTNQSVLYRNDFSVWSIQAQYRVFDGSEALFINAGYMLPYLSRESITSPWSVASLDKMRSSVALRYFVTGKANGISPGITLGGLVANKKLFYGASFMPNTFYVADQPEKQSVLLMGHALYSLFGNEFDHYQYVIPDNAYKQNFGITLGVGGSYQGNSPIFQSNASIGGNFLLAWKRFQLDAEYYQLMRTYEEENFHGFTYHVRGTYTWDVKESHLQTTVAFWEYNGDDDLFNISVSRENSLDAGVDYFPDGYPLKVGIHYTYSLAKNKFTYAPSIQKGQFVNAVTLKLQATIK